MKVMNLHCLHRFHFIASSLRVRKAPSRERHPFGTPDSLLMTPNHEQLQGPQVSVYLF